MRTYPALPARIGSRTPVECLARRRNTGMILYKTDSNEVIKLGERKLVWPEHDFICDNRIIHPNVVKIDENSRAIYTGPADDNMFKIGLAGPIEVGYFAMEFMEGRTLADVIEGRGLLDLTRLERRMAGIHEGLNPIQVVNHMFGIAQALLPLWHNGRLHGDIKPDNIMEVTEQLWKIFDFQIGALYAAGIIPARRLDGSPPYLPREAFLGHFPDHRRDFYAMGITIYTLVMGRSFNKHFKGQKIDAAAFDNIDYAQIFSNSMIPEPLREFLLKNCTKDIKDRISDPQEFMRDFEEVRRELAG